MGRPSNTDERREQIARALLKVMARRGFDGASVAEVARAARLAPGLVHYHFKDKHEILLAAVDELVGAHRARLDERLGQAGEGPRERLDAFLDAHVGLGASADPDALACWVQVSGEALRDKAVGRAFEGALGAVHERLEAIVVDGVARGVFACDDPKAAAAALLAAIQGYFVLAATARGLIPRGSALGALRGMAGGLLGPGAAPRSEVVAAGEVVAAIKTTRPTAGEAGHEGARAGRGATRAQGQGAAGRKRTKRGAP